MDTFEDTSHKESAWLSPEDALAFFEPPEGVNLSATTQVQQQVRARYGFKIGDLGLLINPDVGSEVLSMPQIATLPNTPSGFLGLINLRGNLVPVYELRNLLDLPPRPASVTAMVLVFGKDDSAVGITIEGYPDILLDLTPMSHLPTLSDLLQKHVSAGFIKDDTVWLEFNHNTFFEEISGAKAADAQDGTYEIDN